MKEELHLIFSHLSIKSKIKKIKKQKEKETKMLSVIANNEISSRLMA